ncbi:MAG: NUDIX domain-containing protein [Bacteroidetes bacterium]|nr:MAG: NUDIX domain-containing protein [Bacteroidota bacterium]
MPGLTIDCVIFGFEDDELKVLLIRRDIEPQRGAWGLPGDWLGQDEDLDLAAVRLLKRATGLEEVYMEQLRAFGRVSRFPHYRIVTVAYSALIDPQRYRVQHGPDTSDIRWFNIHRLPNIHFDHQEIMEYALKELRRKVRQYPIGVELLPDKFTMPRIFALYRTILGEDLDRRNFRKKMLKNGLLHKLDEKETGKAHRAADLYSFDQANYERLKKEGFPYAF